MSAQREARIVARDLRSIPRRSQLYLLALLSLLACARQTEATIATALPASMAAAAAAAAAAPTASNADLTPRPLLTRWSALPYLRSDAHAAHASSADPSMSNADYNNVLAHDGSESVIFDAVGPGVIDRFWHTALMNLGQFKFYFDDESTPRWTSDASDLWNASVSPFVAPLSLAKAQSGGGSVTYLPIAFAKSLRITEIGNDDGLEYYNIDYTRYPDATLASFTGAEDVAALAATLTHVGADPNPADATSHTIQTEFDIARAGSHVVADIAGPAEITALSFESAALAHTGSHARLQIFWDGEVSPSVDAPLADFFLTGLAERGTTYALAKSLALGFDGARFYCFFPMPFATRAHIVLVDDHSDVALKSISAAISVRDFGDDFARVGRFHATQSQEAATVVGRDFTILDVRGSGQYVGLNLRVPPPKTQLEGNDRAFIDGSRSPQIAGTGTEDYFNGAWYFNPEYPAEPGARAFSDALTGCPTCTLGKPQNMYRLLIDDALPFTSSLRLTIQHGPDDGASDGNREPYTSVAFYYLNERPLSVQTDTLTLSDDDDMARHTYTPLGDATASSVTSVFWSDDTSNFTYQGTTLDVSSSFSVDVDPVNVGVTLRRLLDQSVGDQTAQVRVDGDLVGTWRTLGTNANYRWREDDFFIPRAYTQGKSRLNIDIQVQSAIWNEYHYDVFSILAP